MVRNPVADGARHRRKGTPAWRALIVASLCVAGSAVGVVPLSAPAGADTATFSSAQIGMSGSTPTFDQTGPWTLSWTYNCSNLGSEGTFSAEVDQPASSLNFDAGPDELGVSGSGTDHYYDTGRSTSRSTATAPGPSP